MRTARHWARATVTIDGAEDPRGGVVGLGWSDVSEHEARRVALERARRAAAALREERDPAGDEYPYPDRPVCEPIIDELYAGDRVVAAITRNAKGVLVLNTAEAMFIDIDRQMSAMGCLAALLGAGGGGSSHEREAAQRLHQLAEREPGLGLRLYRTAGGLRVLVTGRSYDPAAEATGELMRSLKADKRYIMLCRMQACYRARLTPKPWRCGLPRAPRGFPFENDDEREAFEVWRVEYERAANGYAVCELVEQIGRSTVSDAVRPILTLHDELTCRGSLPLA